MEQVCLPPTSDKSIRSALLLELRKHYFQREHTRIIPEFTLPNTSARVDVAVVNGIMHGYELKSDLDTLSRLNHQADEYSAIFDKVTLVVGKKLVVHALEMVPNWWGITVAKSRLGEVDTMLIPVRNAGDNPNQDLFAVANLLRKDEALECLREMGVILNSADKSKKLICKKLVDVLGSQELKDFVRDKLINRRFNREKQVALLLN